MGGTAVAGGTGFNVKTGETVTVVPEMVTDCEAMRSRSSEVLELVIVTGLVGVMV